MATGVAIVALTALAPFLGGSTQLWAQAAICSGCGLLFVLAPPRFSLGLFPNSAFIALLFLALLAFLPARWLTPDPLHVQFSQLGIQLPETWSPQPWLTLGSSCLLLLGLAWTYYLFAQPLDLPLRIQAWRVYTLAILSLAAILTVANALKLRVPFWPDVKEFGFFPNRNQTSNVLALGGIMIYATGLQHFREHKKNWWVWLASLSLICWALILNYSRSGIILLFAGVLAWHLWWLKTSKWRSRAIFALGGFALMLALFVAVGGETLSRFGGATMQSLSPAENARVAIYHDALELSAQSPAIGIGLGNFPAVFSPHRQTSIAENMIIHPESDWLWAAVEMGWFAPLLLAILFYWWIKQTIPFEHATCRLMRAAAMICGCAFAVHGLCDVSGHRLGALWPALFLASTAIHPAAGYKPSRVVAVLFRFLGVILISVGAWWFLSISGAKTWPTTAQLDRINAQIETATDQGDYSAVLDLSSKGLDIAPLDWSLYYKRGAAEAALFYSPSEARRDFAAAGYLLPHWQALFLGQGKVWLSVGEPDFAFAAWADALRRFPGKAPELYAQMFDLIKSDVTLLDRWRALARGNKVYLLVFLQNAGRLEFDIELRRLLSEDRQLASFSADQLKILFSAWFAKGDKEWLAQTLEDHPEWRKIAWRELARIYAERDDYHRAYETAQQFTAPPDLPKPRSHEPLETLKARFLLNRTDLSDGLNLYFAQINEGRIDDALRTARELAALPGSPNYLFYLESELWAQKGDWKEAWHAFYRFAAKR